MPPGAKYVGRGKGATGRFGNPWTVADGYTREEAVARFAEHLRVRRDPPPGWVDVVGYPSDEEIRAELGGRDLACWCPLPEPGEPDHCHAQVLLRLAAVGGELLEARR